MYRYVGVSVLVFISVLCTNAQEQQIINAVPGVSFQKVGQIAASDSSSYSLILGNASPESGTKPVAHISVASQLYVDLPGSYGGKLYYESPDMKNLTASRVQSDSFDNGSVKFTREYWVVYAGMGAWEEVINCYTQQNGRYYIVSFSQDVMLGKPGMEVEGKQITRKEIRAKAIASLTDTTNLALKQFNELLTSIRIAK